MHATLSAPAVPHPTTATPAAQPAPARWAVRGALSALLAWRTIDVCWVADQALHDPSGDAARWLMGGTSLNMLVMALNAVMLIGGSSILAIVAVLSRWSIGRAFALASGYLTLAWLAMQIVAVGPGESWRLPPAIVATVASLLVSWMLPDPEARA